MSFSDINRLQLTSLWPEYFDYDREIRQNVESDSKYSFYIERQAYEVKKMKTNIGIKIPKSLIFIIIVVVVFLWFGSSLYQKVEYERTAH